MRKKVLVISYFFPPASSTGGTRPLKFVKFLRDFGWEPFVLTVKKSFDFGVSEDARLLDEIPEGVSVYRTFSFEPLNWYWLKKEKAVKPQGKNEKQTGQTHSAIAFKPSWKTRLIDFFHIPDRYCGWILFGVLRGLFVVRKEKPKVIFATTPCPSALVIGYLISLLSGRPLIVDYRDPWTDPCAGFVKAPFVSKVHGFLERLILRHAKRIICVSQTRLDELLSKYNINSTKGEVITNGYDSDDLKEVYFEKIKKDSCFKLIHPGQLYGRGGVEEFLLALDELVRVGFIDAESIHVQFVGSRPDVKIFDDLEKRGVCEYLPRMPKGDVLLLMDKADIFLLFLGDSICSRGWIVSKIFDYMLFQKAILGIVPQGETQKIIEKCRMGYALRHDVGEIKLVLEDIYRRYQSGKLQYRDNEDIKQYARRELTKRFAFILEQVVKEKEDL